MMHTPRRPRHAGFTLLEISIVLAIVGVIIGMGFSSTKSMLETTRLVATQEKMKVIEAALREFWITNNRLPCPADPTLKSGDVGYGIEAADNNILCFGGTPSALERRSFTFSLIYNSHGSLPFNTLDLNETYGLDAWGNKITYGTSNLATADNSAYMASRYMPSNAVSIFSNDVLASSNAHVSTGPEDYMAVLISHGTNGLGAYTKKGVLIAGTDDATEMELRNAALATTTPYASSYLAQYYFMRTPEDGDDVVRGISLSNLSDDYDPTASSLMRGKASLFFTSSATPYTRSYAWDGAGFTQTTHTSNPSSAPLGKILASTSGSLGNNYVIYAGDDNDGLSASYWDQSTRIHGFSVTTSGAAATSGPTMSDINSAAHKKRPTTWPAGGPAPLDVGQGELVFAYDDSPYLQFATDTDYNDGLKITLLDRDDDSDHDLADAERPGGVPSSTEYSQASGHLAVSHDDSRTASEYVSIYKRPTALAFTNEKIDDAIDTQPTGDATDVAFSNDGHYLAVSHDVTPFVTIYEVSGETYSKLPDPAELPTGNANAVSFSADSQFMVVAHETAPYITVYKIDTLNDVFTKLDDPDDLPSGTANDVDFAGVGTKFAVAVDASGTGNKPLLLYDVLHGELVTKQAAPDSALADNTEGHAVEFADRPYTKSPRPSFITGGLTTHWKFDETSGSTAIDSAGSKNGSFSSTPTWSTEPSDALASTGSVEFPASGQRMDYASTTISPSTGFTMSWWFKSNGTSYSGNTFSGTSSTSSNRIQPLTNTSHRFRSNTITTFTVPNLWNREWRHIIITGASNSVRMYVDGVESTTGARTNTDAIDINRMNSYGDSTANGVNGLVDDVRFYNRALTADEIVRIYSGDG